jgi:hypothetical protein
LCLLVKPNGAKWWRFRYEFGGVEKMLSPGVYPDVPLSFASRGGQAEGGLGARVIRKFK